MKILNIKSVNYCCFRRILRLHSHEHFTQDSNQYDSMAENSSRGSAFGFGKKIQCNQPGAVSPDHSSHYTAHITVCSVTSLFQSMIQSVLLWLDTHLVDTQNPTITTKNYDSCDNFPSSDTVDWSRGIISSDKVKKNYRADSLLADSIYLLTKFGKVGTCGQKIWDPCWLTKLRLFLLMTNTSRDPQHM